MPAQTVIKVRRDSAADWTSTNPTLAEGEHGYETDTGKFKIGTGSTAWTSLVYAEPKVTASKALASDTNGYVSATSVTSTELGYVSGVTSAIQTQLNGKSGLVAVEPSANTNTATSVGYVGLPQVILSTGGLTLTKAHAGEHIYVTGASQTVTIPANDSVPFEIGTTIVVINGNVTSSIAITTDTLRLAGGTTTGTRTLAAYGMATLVKISATEWIASGNGLT
jgi:hypothetical protein